MIKSMTGFGKGEYAGEKRNITVEIKAVNHRYCDIYVKIPKKYAFAEEKIKSIAKNVIKRGKIEISVMIDNLSDSDVNVRLNEDIAKQYYDNLVVLASKLNLENKIDLEYIAGLPDVMKNIPDVEDEDEIFACIKEALEKAVANFDEMRKVEGAKLAEDMLGRGKLIRSLVEEISQRAPMLQEIYANRLVERVKEILGSEVEIPEEKILIESVIFADKVNITEELVRLDSHMIQMENIINSPKSEGKKLDFLIQEMNRETNTIGSKANDLDITEKVLDIKSEIEKIREQAQNIE